jgi:hypothetical protein
MNDRRWAAKHFRKGRLIGTPLPAMREAALASRAAATSGLARGDDLWLVAGIVFGVGVFVGYFVKKWWNARKQPALSSATSVNGFDVLASRR